MSSPSTIFHLFSSTRRCTHQTGGGCCCYGEYAISKASEERRER
jgi:hypothetical protein